MFTEITLNPNTRSGLSSTESIFDGKIKPDFKKILPEQKAQTSTDTTINKYLNPGVKVFFNMY